MSIPERYGHGFIPATKAQLDANGGNFATEAEVEANGGKYPTKKQPLAQNDTIAGKTEQAGLLENIKPREV